MTRDDAIAHGKEQLEIFGGQHQEFIRMAIRSLEAWDDVTAEFAMAVPWCIDTEEDRAYMKGLNTGYNIVQKHIERIEDED